MVSFARTTGEREELSHSPEVPIVLNDIPEMDKQKQILTLGMEVSLWLIWIILYSV